MGMVQNKITAIPAPVHGTGFKKYRGTGTVLFEKLLNQYTTLA